jgi:hypothetical protein
MADITAHRTATATLSTTTVDKITMSGNFRRWQLVNHGGVAIYATKSVSADPITPTAGGEECDVILPGERVEVEVEVPRSLENGASAWDVRFKLIGNGNTYSVVGLP